MPVGTMSPPRNDNLVYRVAGIPSALNSKAAAETFLDEFFDTDDVHTTVRSLGLHHQKDSLVAVVGFLRIPRQLSSGSPWRLEKSTHIKDRYFIAHLEIDTQFLGFTPLNIPRNDSQYGTIDCVVVSGLSSHPFGSWKQRGGQYMWLADDSETFPPNVRVLLYGYDSTLVGSTSIQDIDDIGSRLATEIRGIRPLTGSSPSHEPSPLVFIAHSLGGLVVKEAICHMAQNDAADAQCIYGLVFFGVPHFGLLVEPWLSILGGQPNCRFIEDLRANSRALGKLDDKFRKVFTFSGSRVVSLFETMTSGTIQKDSSGVISRTGDRKLMVEPSSAVGRWPDSTSHTQIPMNRSHEDLPKFTGQFDYDFLVLRPLLEEMWAKAVRVVQARLDATSLKAEEGAPEPSLGLIQLWPYKEMGDSAKTEIDIVAIHGLWGHSHQSWMDADRLWLRDFLPSQFSYVRVFTYGYESDLAFLGDGSSIEDCVTRLLEALLHVHRRDQVSKKRRTIFVCHSLGGILFKQAFNIAKSTNGRYSSVGESIIGVIFLGTPHCGLDGPDRFWPELFARLASLHNTHSDHRVTGGDADIVRWAKMKEICTQFETLGMGLQIFSCFEMHQFRGSKVLDKSFSILQRPNETTMPLSAHHNDICKFLTSSSSNYLTVSGFIEELIGSGLRSEEEPKSSGHDKTMFLSNLRAIDMPGLLGGLPVPFENSASWLLGHPEFRSWISVQGRQTLWLHGPPGIGKTVLMRSAVAYLEDRSNRARDPIVRKPVYFFFDDKDLTRKTSNAFVRSVLFQMLADERTGPLLDPFLEKKVPTGVNAEEGLWKTLSTIVSRSHGIVFQFVVDAADEALRNTSDVITIVDRLQELLALDWSGRTKLLISSRTPVGYGFRDVGSIDMSNDATKANIETFIHAKVQQAIQASRLLPQAGPEVQQRISNRARGNFLLAKLTWEQFSKGQGQSTWSREQTRARLLELDTVSPEFVSVYCTLLRGIPEMHRNKIRTSLAILRVAKAKLSRKQLAFFATLRHHEMDPENRSDYFDEIEVEAENFEAYMLETCGYLIHQDANGTVDFAHISARDLFSGECEQAAPQEDRQILSRFAISDPEAHAVLHMLCLSTLFLEDRATWVQDYTFMVDASNAADTEYGPGSNHAYQARVAAISSIGRTPCFVYALRFFLDHYAAASEGAGLDQQLLEFLPTMLAYWCHVFCWPLLAPVVAQSVMRYMIPDIPAPPLLRREYALFRTLARVDCHRIVKAMLVDGINVNYVPTKDLGYGFTLLSWTILSKRPESFKVLLRNEVTAVNYSDPPQALKPVHYAAQIDDVFYIRTLVERRPDVDINAKYDTMSGSGTALHTAIHMANILGAQSLLDQPGIDIWAKDGDGISAYSVFFLNRIWGPLLCKIIRLGQVSQESLKLAISKTSQFLMADIHQWTELQEEILRLVPETVLQLDRDQGMNALVHYAYFGRKEKLLWTLERIPKRDFPIRQDSSRYDLLHLCANQGWEDIVYLLQRRYGLRSLKSDHFGRTLLHWAMDHYWDTGRIVWAEYASLLDVQDHDGRTAMHLAVINRDRSAVELLVESGANCFLRDKRGMTPVHSAAELGFRDALNCFLGMDRREYGRTTDGASLLHLIAIWFDGTLVKRFVVSKKALVNVVDAQGRTPLHYAAMAGNSSSVQQLLELNARVDRRDKNGMTALHESIRGRFVDTAMLLLQNGADCKASDGFRQNCLHLCLRYGADGLLPYLLDHGVNVNQVDSFGMRPLHRACGVEGGVTNIHEIIRRGADWKLACDSTRRSPLITAVENGRSDAVATVVSCLQDSGLSSRRQQRVLDEGLRVASELESTAIEQILLTAGAWVDKATIQVRRWYLPGAEPEYNRLPLVHYDSSIQNPFDPNQRDYNMDPYIPDRSSPSPDHHQPYYQPYPHHSYPSYDHYQPSYPYRTARNYPGS